jgi:hypothetical protein
LQAAQHGEKKTTQHHAVLLCLLQPLIDALGLTSSRTNNSAPLEIVINISP